MRLLRTVAAALLLPIVYLVSPARAADCGRTSTGVVPLNDPFVRSYQGMEGGLYPKGLNHRPASHEAAGLREGAEVRPRDPSGAVDEANGKIVLLSIGMSNTTQEFSVFKKLADADPEKNPKLVIVDGAQGGWSAERIVAGGDPYWATVNTRLAAAGVTAAQVQTGWLKEAIAGPTWPFPEDAQRLEAYLRSMVRDLRSRFPNLRLLYFSSRTYAGYASSALNPEPYAFQSGFSVKWLIEKQLNGDPELSFEAGQAPWLAWGPYLWADGTTEREDGLIWECGDLQASDGTHPSSSGQQKVAEMLLDFLKSDSTARPWFVRPAQQEVPPPSPAAIVNAADYSPRIAAGSIASIYGSELSTATAAALRLPLPPVLGGAVVRIGGEPAPLYYVSPQQINFLVPARQAGEDVVVVREGIASAPLSLSADSSAPAIFTLDGWPDGPAAAVHADGRVVTPQTPAEPGESVTLFLTGLGRRNPALLAPTVMPVVRVGDRQARVNGTGPVAGSPGLDRIDFTVPPETIAGSVWLTVGTPTAAGVSTLTISATNAGGSNSKQLSLTVNAAALAPVSVNLQQGQIQQFTTAVSGTTNQAVTWSLNPAVGTLSTTGRYTAPATVLAAQTVTVTAQSAADPTKSASAVVSLQLTPVATQWSIGYYTPFGGGYPVVADLPFSALTHIAFVGGTPQANGAIVLTSGFSSAAPALISAAHAAGVKVLFVLGDGGGGSFDFSGAITNNLSTFVTNIMNVVNTYGFDGVDIDYEAGWSKARGSSLASALRTALGVKLLTSAAQINHASDYTNAALAQYLDRVNIMTYGMAGTWDSESWFGSALYGPSPAGWTTISVNLAVGRFLSAGTPAAKLGIGIPFYGVRVTGNGVNAPRQGVGTTYAEVQYSTILANYNVAGGTYDSEARVPWVAGGGGWISWDNPASIAEKIQYVKDNNLGGWIIWQINGDYFPAGSPKHPLLTAIGNAMGVTP